MESQSLRPDERPHQSEKFVFMLADRIGRSLHLEEPHPAPVGHDRAQNPLSFRPGNISDQSFVPVDFFLHDAFIQRIDAYEPDLLAPAVDVAKIPAGIAGKTLMATSCPSSAASVA